jgi:hypothetical protein
MVEMVGFMEPTEVGRGSFAIIYFEIEAMIRSDRKSVV